ncbi:MAG TPA: hypothetical protein VGP62_26230 [Bryobacteraceae bacterium]|jgi:hypothetical protein|nr:hypothetical protein [Bryobacteraceae bacterium]
MAIPFQNIRDGSYTPKPSNGKRDSQAWLLAQRNQQGMKPVLAIATNFRTQPDSGAETLQESAARLASEIDSLRKRLSSR